MYGSVVGEARTRVCLLGGPTILLEVGGLRLLTDPTFDGPGEYDTGRGYNLVKTQGPATSSGEIGRVDVVLLSHDQHADNLDTSGRAFLTAIPHVLTTASGAERLGSPVTPMPRWSWVEIECPGGGALRITGVPAQHGPDGTEAAIGEVTGFVLSGQNLPTIYISGDNASVEVVRSIAKTIGRIDIAILFAGGARSPLLGTAYLTLNGTRAAEAARELGASWVIPIHVDGWTHFSEGVHEVRDAFTDAGIADRLLILERGGWTDL